MSDIILRDIDPVLAGRIGRIGAAHGWSAPETLLRLLEHGLLAWEGAGTARLSERESGALQSAIVALEQVPDDPGFALIGRAPPLLPAPEQPDQHIVADFSLD